MREPDRSVISVIIPTRSRTSRLEHCLASLCGQQVETNRFEVIVVDDGSDVPVTASLDTSWNDRLPLRIVRQPAQGVSAARARGVGEARGWLCAFLDDDCVVPADYLARATETFTRYPDTQVVQVRLVNADPTNRYGRLWSFLVDETLRVNVRRTADGRFTSTTLGGVLVCRRELFSRVAWDPSLPGASEDADLRCQIVCAGIPIHYAPEIVVYHHCRTTLWECLAQQAWYGRGAAHLHHKWGPTAPPVHAARLLSRSSLRELRWLEGGRGVVRAVAELLLIRQAGAVGRCLETAKLEHGGRRARRIVRAIGLLAAHAAREARQAIVGVTSFARSDRTGRTDR